MSPKPRRAKPAPERRAEILDVAKQLFITKGVKNTAMEDVAKQIGVAKGTLYYHFTSKEEILHALITRTSKLMTERAHSIVQSDMPAVEKLLAVLAATRAEEEERELAEELHATGNAEFHILSIVESVRNLTPILTEIVEQGIAEGSFNTTQARENIEILLTSAGMLLDEGIFLGEAKEIPRRTVGLVNAAETLLGCKPGTFAQLLDIQPD